MDEIEIIKQRLIEQVNPICIYLFGSFANGTAHAESDLDFYIVVNDGEKDLHAIVASAHKAIKAVIVSLHWPTGIPKSHDLSFLLNQIHNYISIPDAIGDAADALTPFGTMTRYPNELTVEEHHAKQAIAFAEQILNWTASALR